MSAQEWLAPVVRNFETVPGIFRRCRGFSAL
jgi:hypothetical protein